MSSIKYIDYQGKSILFIDLEGAASDFDVLDLGEKAKKLVKLSRKAEIYVLYNMTGISLTKSVMLNLRRLMEHASLVSRRVFFGVMPQFTDLVRQAIVTLNLANRSRFADNYTQALNMITDDAEWVERRKSMPGSQANMAVPAKPQAAPAVERRHDPNKVYKEEDYLKTIEKMDPSK